MTIDKVESDYIAYRLEVNDSNRDPSFTAAQLDSLRKTAVHTEWTEQRLRGVRTEPKRTGPDRGLLVQQHSGRYRALLDSLIGKATDALLASRLLIVDLRGSSGGGSLTTQPLMPFIHAEPEREPPGPEGDPVVRASADNLAYFSRWKRGDSTPEWLSELLSRMGRPSARSSRSRIRPTRRGSGCRRPCTRRRSGSRS